MAAGGDVTRDAAERLAGVARRMEGEGHAPEDVARLLMRWVLARFAEAAGLPQAGDARGLPPTLVDEAAGCDWSEVEPAILGTLLERALDRRERHRLGAHYTPRAYVERLVRPTVEAPLRAAWEGVQATARAAGHDAGRDAVRAFHTRLCGTRVLDPACGTGNFLYVAFDVLKQLEREVLAVLGDLGGETPTRVTPSQLLGLDVKPWAAEIARAVLWIGALRWHRRARGEGAPPVPADLGNIACRDALLDWNERGSPRQASWPDADYVVGNPPFLGKSRRRRALGDGYDAALLSAYPSMPEGADYVMWWWHRAARLVEEGRLARFGLITTNSVAQALNRRVVAASLATGRCTLLWAVPDHPWVDGPTGAQVRVAMTVAGRGGSPPAIVEVRDGVVVSTRTVPEIHADLRGGPDVTAARPLRENRGRCSVGLVLFGQGFVVTRAEAEALEPGACHPYVTARDLVQHARGLCVVDLHPEDEAGARTRFPKALQHVATHVKPGRDRIRDPSSRARWWRFGRDKPELRSAVAGLARYIVTPEVARWRTFHFVAAGVAADHTLVAVASADPADLGVLSSRPHVVWAAATGSRLGAGNDLRYNKSRCFETFPFPVCGTEQRERLRVLGERLDAHRKAARGAHPELTVTAMYNVLEKLRRGVALTERERGVHDRGGVTVLRQIHDALDAAVLDAYGWPAEVTDEQIVEELVALNRSPDPATLRESL